MDKGRETHGRESRMKYRELTRAVRPMRWHPGAPAIRSVTPPERLSFDQWAKYIHNTRQCHTINTSGTS